MRALRIINAGPSTSLQDIGRPGLRRYGIPISGALDQFSYRLANALVRNAAREAALEIAFPGLVVEALTRISVAVTGGDLGLLWNNEPAPTWTTLRLNAGDRLQFSNRVSGCRAYLAIEGGFDGPEYYGSRSTFAMGGMGTVIQPNTILSLRAFLKPSACPIRLVPALYRPEWKPPFAIRVVLGPQTDYFTRAGLETFLKSEYRVSQQMNRQGFRTEGPRIEQARGSDIISDPTPLGAVQVPGDRCPIILHRDGQATGGYAKIATVISADLDRFGQMSPGDPIRFHAVLREEALRLAAQWRQRLDLITAMLTM